MRVLLFQEEDMWVAQCLEYDIAAHGETVTDAQEAYALAFVSQVVMAFHLGEEPLAKIGKAPQQYWEMLENSLRLAAPITAPDADEIPPNFMFDPAQKSLAESWIAV
ncbi:MAG: hypothetical protein OXK81_02120 [Chloroflexota bacterium]|nr:hypothetical protein [Chloroflexota bacterium]MDE2932126.1 hypothetical protein [Chloroflexota bacterium]